jgi:hypothetical protein
MKDSLAANMETPKTDEEDIENKQEKEMTEDDKFSIYTQESVTTSLNADVDFHDENSNVMYRISYLIFH